MDLTWTLLAIIATYVITHTFLTKTYDYWKKQNVPSLPNPLPGFGHMWPVISLKNSLMTFAVDVYENSKTSMVGFYFMRKPGLVLCEPELVKNVMVTNFSNFSANGIVLNEKTDPILSKNPFVIADHRRWKVARAHTISNLSSQNLKSLFNIVKDVCQNMNDYVDRKIKENNDSFESELKDTFARYTSEIVANCAFGMEGHSFEDNPDPLTFINSEDFDSTISDVLIFYAGLYETSSTVLAILFYHLSQNQEVQRKLRSHIVSIIQANKGHITFESLKSMNYLDQVISESLRLLPPAFAFRKECTKETTLTGSDGLQCHVRPGTVIMIPLMGLQNDSKYWDKPHVFDPDRFNPENHANHREGAYLPFGDGPRKCVGIRLALMLVKLAVATLLKNFSIQSSTKMKAPLEMEAFFAITHIKGGFWGKFEKL
ncbi:cytochrome P450 6k1-like [Copidosoma floridanum]|uniref:cytochrome P450 6k1-like n=1 Tax=Copidosoma floridanum TaxID=29053 RepID=UPI000C6F81C1|nr:cytochrome P450 6k1-like [Copidosoma floridanum]